MSLTPEQVKLYNGMMDKLKQASAGTSDTEPDPIKNPAANCLIKSVIFDLISFNHSLGN